MLYHSSLFLYNRIYTDQTTKFSAFDPRRYKMSFWFKEVLPDVYQIEDALGVCMTLLTGEDKALLVDAGYGIEDAASFARELADRPVRLILTHGHYDHILGASWFPEAWIFEEDTKLASDHEKKMWRRRALEAAENRGIRTDEKSFLSASDPVWRTLEEGRIDLGGLSAVVIKCPGHTPGSAVIYVPERSLLLTGDDWNPCTWLFFPEALSVGRYLENIKKLLKLDFRHVLCPHSRELHSRSMLENFINGLTEETLLRARPVDTGEWLGIRTFEAEPAFGQCLVFDADKK